MSNKEEKISAAEDNKLSDEELENVSGGAVVITKKQVDLGKDTSDIVTAILK
ncbi:MAG: bacteriocin [Clostridia bacterium]|nr:bacteriocin [Clostridia bacterium]